MSAPTRIDDDLFDQARAASRTHSRSAAQQINHWARLGAAVEASRIAHRDVEDVLAGRRPYDDLDDELSQAAVRVGWAEELNARREALDLAREFAAEGRPSWISANEDGTPATVTGELEG